MPFFEGYIRKFSLSFLIICLHWVGFFILCACDGEAYLQNPDHFFSEKEKNALLMQLVLKMAEKPEGLATKEEIEAYYQNEVQTYHWHYAVEKDGKYFFLISRPAPSLYGKRSAIGGFFESSDRMQVKKYNEVFHSFKFLPAELEKKGALLFEKMVKGEDLKGYQPGGNRTNKQEWIEFPDDLHYFDGASQTWKTKGVEP
jgi:hypothetical protein